jgi:hypothetical protein
MNDYSIDGIMPSARFAFKLFKRDYVNGLNYEMVIIDGEPPVRANAVYVPKIQPKTPAKWSYFGCESEDIITDYAPPKRKRNCIGKNENIGLVVLDIYIKEKLNEI